VTLAPAADPPGPAYFTAGELTAMRHAITVADRLDMPPGLGDEEATYRALYGAAVRLGYHPGDDFTGWAVRVRMEDLGAVLKSTDEPTADPT
jgi:hypothetical protein